MREIIVVFIRIELNINAVNKNYIDCIKLSSSMRKLTLACFIMSTTLLSHAQFYKSILPSGAFTDSLQQVVASYEGNFYSIQSENISQLPDVDTYRSKRGIPGAKECYIMRYHSVVDTTAGWQALMYKGEDYREAVKAYKNCFRLVKKSNLKIDESIMKFNGELEEPQASLKFTVSSLKPSSSLPAYKNFYAEVELVQVYLEWEVRLNLHSRKADDERYNY
ncbi:MAG: hypothetical protein ABIW38_12365 [Ferruginibacter sp.]